MADDPSTPPAPAPDPAGGKKVSRAPRQGATMGEKQAAQQGAAPAPIVDPAQLSPQLLAALSQALGTQVAPPAAPPPSAAERTLIAREEKRFRRASTTPAAEASPPTAEPAALPRASEEPPVVRPPVIESPASELEEARQDAERGVHLKAKEVPSAPIPSTRQLWRRMPRERRALYIVIAAALAASVGSFFLGRASAPALPAGTMAGPAGSPAATLENASPGGARLTRLAEPEEIARIDAALQALTTKDLPRAEAALVEIQKDAPNVPGTFLTLALLEMQRGNVSKSDQYIALGLSSGEPAGPYYELRASMASRTNQRKRAEEALFQATRADPYSWRYLFRWADYLRRLGRNESALEKMDLALARIHDQADEDLMQYKRALILIALGRGAEIDAELARRSAENPPRGEWLLVGLAREAARGNMVAAARWLQRAIQNENAAWVSEQLRDFYLQQWCYEKELVALYRPFMPRTEATREPEANVSTPDADAAQTRQQAKPPLASEPLPDVTSRAPAGSAPAATPSSGKPAATPAPTPLMDLSNLPPPPK